MKLRGAINKSGKALLFTWLLPGLCMAHPGRRNPDGGHRGPDGDYHYHHIGRERTGAGDKNNKKRTLPPLLLGGSGPKGEVIENKLLPAKQTPSFVQEPGKITADQFFPYRKIESDPLDLTATKNSGLVLEVISGKLIRVEINGNPVKIRLQDVTVPPLKEKAGQKCRAFLSSAVEGKVVQITHHNIVDENDCLMAEVYWNGVRLKDMLEKNVSKFYPRTATSP